RVLTLLTLYLLVPLGLLAMVRLLLPASGGHAILGSMAFFWSHYYRVQLAESPWMGAGFLYSLLVVGVWQLPGIVATKVGLAVTVGFLRSDATGGVLAGLLYLGLVVAPSPSRFLCYAAPVVIGAYLSTVDRLVPRRWLLHVTLGALSVAQVCLVF